jgi:hypothetical protein
VIILQAKEYLDGIRAIKHRLQVADKELNEARKTIYSLQAVDFSKDKVDGGEPTDLSNKIEQAEKIVAKVEERKRHLVEMREEARERINALPDFDVQSILIDYAINVAAIWEMCKNYHYSRSGYNKRFRKAIACFQKNYADWLENLDFFD